MLYDSWLSFCRDYHVWEDGQPLFESDKDLRTSVIYRGSPQLPYLKRSAQMESIVKKNVQLLKDDYTGEQPEYDGVIYMMYWRNNQEIIPLYIGKSEKFGKGYGNLSNNINATQFLRWGYGYAYHMGDLSAVVCNNHFPERQTRKYQKWANKLFVPPFPTNVPTLVNETFFWMRAWSGKSNGIWKEYGETSLTFLEYLLIGVASKLFPDTLLNLEGVNRSGTAYRLS